jgi:integrase
MSQHKRAGSDAIAVPEAKPKRKPVKMRGKDGVYKRGGVWFAIVEYPRDSKTGTRTRKQTEGVRTRREAEVERDRLRNEIRSGIDTAPEKLTVAALLDRWIAGKTTLADTTRERYRGLIARVKPHIGSTPVPKLRPAHVQELYTTLLTRCRLCTIGAAKHRCRAPLSPTSVRHVHGLLKEVLAWAVRMQILARNPIEAVQEDAPARAMPKVDAFTDAEIVALLDAARGTPWDTAIMLALATGARRGELAALRWADACFETGPDGSERGTVTIRASFSETSAGVTLKSTKTGRERTVPLSSLAIEALRIQRFRRAEDAFRAENDYADEGFVFADLFGRPHRPLAFTLAFRAIAKKAGVRKRLHDARHWTASHLLGSGVDVVTAATILGHSSPQTTLTVYAHQLAGLKEDAMAKLDGRLRAAIERRK